MADVSDAPLTVALQRSLQFSGIYNGFWLRRKMYSISFTKTIILLYK